MTHVVVVGGGIGGMVAALRAKKLGAEVTLVEARPQLGGLASPIDVDGMTFDGGPYILLDRVRLAWAFDQVGVDLASLPMAELDPAYRVMLPDRRWLSINSDLDETVASIDQVAPGTGPTYRHFVDQASTALEQLAPLLVRPHHLLEPVKTGAWRAGLWALSSLDQVLRRHRLDGPAADAIRIWTYIAGGNPRRAPGPLALVPALIHRDGAARPQAGFHQIIALVESALMAAGVGIERNTPIAAINHDPTGVSGVTTEAGTTLDADIVIADVGGAAALLDLVDAKPPFGLRLRMQGPLQSPGITAYVAVRGRPASEINFRVTGTPKQATAFIVAGDHSSTKNGGAKRAAANANGSAAAEGTVGANTGEMAAPDTRRPGRIIAPLGHEEARRLGRAGQQKLLDSMVESDWWRDGITDAEVVATRLIPDWGHEFRLRDDAMNLIMARRQLLLGRLPHRIRHIPGLYLAGSWTHPGQWISFCSVSGVLAANRALKTES